MNVSHRNAQDFHKETWFTPKPVYFQKYSALLWLKVVPMQGKTKPYCIHSPVLLNKARIWDCGNFVTGEFLTKTAGFF